MKIYTRTGDEGETGLFGGGRVPKDHPRVSAYGDVDELNAALGVARATAPGGAHDTLLETGAARPLQHRRPPRDAGPGQGGRRARQGGAAAGADRGVRAGHGRHGYGAASAPRLRAPGGHPKAAALHLARTVCRRAERSVVHLAHDAEIPPLFIIYLNRLSDLLFTLARLANHRAGVADVTW